MLAFVPVRSFGDSLRKTDHVDVEAGVFVWGDDAIDEVFGPFIALSGAFNKMLNDNLAVLGTVGYITADGSSEGVDLAFDGIKGVADAVYLLAPANAVDPYVLGGILMEYNKIEGSGGGYSDSEDESDIGFDLGGGVEFDLNPKFLLDLGLLYQNIADFDSIAAKARLGCAINAKTTLVFDSYYAFDENDFYALAGVAVKL